MANPVIEESLKEVKSNGNGNGNNGHFDENLEKLEQWASTTNNPSQALHFYNFYAQTLGLAPDQARFWAEDSVRIDREVQREFAA